MWNRRFPQGFPAFSERWGRPNQLRRISRSVGPRFLCNVIDDQIREQPRTVTGAGTYEAQRRDVYGREGKKGPVLGVLHTGFDRGGSIPEKAQVQTRFSRQDANLQSQRRNKEFTEFRTAEEGWTEVRRRRYSGANRTANGGNGEQQRQAVLWGRGRQINGGKGQTTTCYKCPGRGHTKFECRDPVVCRYCRRVGHYERTCPVAAVERKGENTKYEGMENYLPKVACLVGEFVVGAAEEEEIIQAIVTRFPELMGSKVKKLVTGEILLRQIPPTTCIDLCGGLEGIR